MKARFSIALMSFIALPAVLSAADFTVQAENFNSYYNIGYSAIRGYNGKLEGLDYPDEWTQYTMPSMMIFGNYQVNMMCWGEENVPYTLKLVTFPLNHTPQVIELRFTGRGIGSCSS